MKLLSAWPPEPLTPPTGGPFPPETHPLILGLFQAVPTPYTAWPSDRREHWLATARQIFGLLYTDPEHTPETP